MRRMTYVERANRFDAALSAAASGSDADQVLAGMLADSALDARERLQVAAALGGTRGPVGTATLRQAFTAALEEYSVASKSSRSQQRDLICACVIALAKRDDPAATDLYMAAARHANAIIREYGLSALAPAGDDRAWEEVMARLDEILQRKISTDGRRWEEATSAIED